MNQFGINYRISIYGESHGSCVGVIIDGIPAGIELTPEDFKNDLERRKTGKPGTSSRVEDDIPHLISGVYMDKTTGAPLHIMFENKNVKSNDYTNLKSTPRPGHADFTASKKYNGFNDPRGGGHFSGRLTLCLVAAGVIAKKIIPKINIDARIIELGGSTNFDKVIQEAIIKKDSIGGIIECTANNIPIGWGEPFFNSIESMISHLVFSIPAIKGIEFGSGFGASKMFGSQHNDVLIDLEGHTKTNHSGGINGGISNGNPLIFRVAVKPTSSISSAQNTLDTLKNEMVDLEIIGRHDVCIALRVPVILESVTAIALADLYLQSTK
ncbi:MAG TPA: chorismate synthase [Saprospiraceae bacterium]|nr:chorismate synthase [Saprospiraceae bacterium]